MQNDTQKNLVMAIALSLLVLLGYQYFIAPEPTPQVETVDGTTGETGLTAPLGDPASGSAGSPLAPGAGAVPAIGGDAGQGMSRADAIEGSAARMGLIGDRISGSINLTGGRFDDVTLANYRETVDPDSPLISLFSPAGSPAPYFAEFGWIDQAGNPRAVGDILWQADISSLTPDRPAILTWTDPNGLAFTRTIEVDDDYMFTITDQVENIGSAPVTLSPFGRILQTQTPDYTGNRILHVGAVGVLDDTLEEVNYDDLQDEGSIAFGDTTGWFGITDKYWLTAMAPGDGMGNFDATFNFFQRQGGDRYQVDYRAAPREIAPGGTTSATVHLFVGAKEVNVLQQYQAEYDIERFDMAIDFGWFFFLTKPLLSVLIYFANLLGNFGLAILLVTVFIKIVFFPLANKSYASMSKMKALQPKIVELRENYGDDKQRLQTEMMALYKREKANPVSGCLPIALQIPVFFALYKVLFVSIEMRHAPFFGWIRDLSAADPTNIVNLFGLIPWTPPAIIPILGIWPLLMGVSMFLQQKLNPAPPDPMQAKVFMLMPIMFTFFLAGFPAGLVIYWTWNNILSMTQQYVIMRRMGVAIGGGTTK